MYITGSNSFLPCKTSQDEEDKNRLQGRILRSRNIQCETLAACRWRHEPHVAIYGKRVLSRGHKVWCAPRARCPVVTEQILMLGAVI